MSKSQNSRTLYCLHKNKKFGKMFFQPSTWTMVWGILQAIYTIRSFFYDGFFYRILYVFLPCLVLYQSHLVDMWRGTVCKGCSSVIHASMLCCMNSRSQCTCCDMYNDWTNKYYSSCIGLVEPTLFILSWHYPKETWYPSHDVGK